MHTGRSICSLALWLCLLAGCSVESRSINHPAALAVFTSAPNALASQESEFPLPVIEVAGDPTTLGGAYAAQLREPMRELLDGYLHRWFKSETVRFLAYTAARGFVPHLAPEHFTELSAAADAAGLKLVDALLAQCFLDLSPMTACSSISLPASAFADGVPRLARNLDFPAMDIADRYSIVVVFRPEGSHQFAAVTWPGLLGVLSGMNEHGLVLVNMEVARTQRLPSAMPYTYLYRTVLEQCRTVDEAVRLLESTPRQSANNIMLMDARGARAVVEITPEAVVVRHGGPGEALVSTNHQRGGDRAKPRQCERYDRLVTDAARINGHADVEGLRHMLQRVQQGNSTLQSMVFEPSTRVLYLSTGERAADRQMHRLDLRPYFTATP